MMHKLLILACLCLCPTVAMAADVPVVLTWEANTEPDLAGYRLYQSTIAGQYGPPITTITGTTYRLTIPEGDAETRYFFTITAVDLASNESVKSADVSKVIPAKSVTGSMPIDTPKIALSVVSDTSLSISWETLPSGTGIDIRLMPAPMHWGQAPSVACSVSPCLIVGLTPGTPYEALAKAYTGTLNVDATFSAFSALASAKTLPLVDLPPQPPKGLIIAKATEKEIVITASATDCPRITTSTKGSTTAVLTRTVRCLP